MVHLSVYKGKNEKKKTKKKQIDYWMRFEMRRDKNKQISKRDWKIMEYYFFPLIGASLFWTNYSWINRWSRKWCKKLSVFSCFIFAYFCISKFTNQACINTIKHYGNWKLKTGIFFSLIFNFKHKRKLKVFLDIWIW